ncbi:hypothetical protein [Hydrogenimonas cancrithermarum]|uniref:Uncharacterized protein n=1 Tax=Hydrogenimonas cancrithermarum TaxID=2993563 RepID=A0ABM8FLY0_9BACT|nr:hypothetical protein [Hydrogenimonas cancrithermarum]BDY13374.1 hypothetical protein HCR_16860 [Hydrogenimonas cancrithermarum]
MLIDMIKEREFQEIMEAHIKDMLLYLLESDQPFGLLCNLEHVTFDPPLPEELAGMLQEVTLFMIAGYTFESFEVEERTLFFEAGFGPQNFGSVVSMPILAVLQLLVEETPILINMAQPMADLETTKETSGVKSSLESFLSNPENRKFLKK